MNKELLLLTLLGYDMEPATFTKPYGREDKTSEGDVMFFDVGIGNEHNATVFLHRDSYNELRKRNYKG